MPHANLLALVLAALVLLALGACSARVANQPPTVTLTKPSDGAFVSLGSPLAVEAEASDPDGSVSHVTFAIDGEELAVGAPPYRYAFIPGEARPYTLSATAYDDRGASSEPASATVEAQAAPTLFSVTLALAGEGAGAVTSAPPGLECPESCSAEFPVGEAVTLTAAADEGSSFAGWGGACAGSSGVTCTLDEAEATSLEVEASFEQNVPAEVSVSLSPKSATLAPGESRDFTAEVSGSDAGVRWRASGGSVAGEGLTVTYTPPAEAGDYTLSATSVADESASASAIITVTEPVDANAPFTIVALPDTQNYICSGCRDDPTFEWDFWNPEYFEAQIQWIIDNKEARNIAFVAQLGDLTETASQDEEWVLADRFMGMLDGVVPYGAPAGDHDYYPEQSHSSDYSNYVKYFGESRYQGFSWYGGAGPRELSHYQIFSAGGYRFLNISLEWEALDDTIAWANQVIADNPGLPTIISTHAYISDGYRGGPGRFTSLDSNDQVGNTGEQIFQKLVSPNPQVFMVLNSHFHGTNWREASTYPSSDGEYYQVSQNQAGLSVYEMLSNYQDYTEGGDGWLRLITFEPGGGEGGLDRILVQTYSPVLDAYQRDDLGTQRASEFAFDLDFSERFGVP